MFRTAALVALTVLMPAVLTVAGAQGLPPVPYTNDRAPTSVGDLRVCRAGETTYLLDRAGQIRSLEYARLIPDNTLRVRQSYDRAGTLTGASVHWSGFAGRVLDVRGAFNRQGRLVRESGYRARGFAAPLTAYLRSIPKTLPCG
ncbi:hypothetical protein [Deinococcus yunweiensis]|uniref:hypothetical protein n=1 Tax=Deinococcus yunweiensis TaxID=367282 RepID=UPI00398EE06E